MYAHQVIESLKKEKSNPNYIVSRINNVITDIRNAQHFHFNTVESVIKVLNIKAGCSLFAGDQGEYINPPYELCWFDFIYEDNNRATKNGYLLKQIHPKWIISLYFEYNMQIKKWVPFPYSFMVGLGTSTHELHLDDLKEMTNISDIYCRVSDNILVTDHYRMHSKKMSEEKIYQLGQEGANLTAPLNFALMLINCKNISTKKQNPPTSLNKKRKKNFRQPLFSYNTLQLHLPGGTESKIYDITNSKEEVRLHFCRGHFKTYTKDNPLFGKHVGRYWWTPQIKGNKNKGFIHKDYEINKL